MAWPDFATDYGTGTVGAFAVLQGSSGRSEVCCVPSVWTSAAFPIFQQTSNHPWLDHGGYKIQADWESGWLTRNDGGTLVVNGLRLGAEIPESNATGGIPDSELLIWTYPVPHPMMPNPQTYLVSPRPTRVLDVPVWLEAPGAVVKLQFRGPIQLTSLVVNGQPKRFGR